MGVRGFFIIIIFFFAEKCQVNELEDFLPYSTYCEAAMLQIAKPWKLKINFGLFNY